MTVTVVSDKLSISPQPSVDELRLLHEQGFTALINNRPDGEDSSRPGSRAEFEEAKSQGLSYAFIPVTADTMTEADIRAFQDAVAASTGPVLAHCKTGKRSLSL